ncbi:DNA polymerase III subunit delta [Candidatus Saccharibacteria bacterium]|nr:MAG: DNA polymerase III subunit delta [Candidatus Saccharibacteria bacterium]
MITVVTGANAYALQAAVKARIGEFIAQHGDMGLERLDGDEAGVDRIGEALSSLPFLTTKKLVVLRGAAANKQFAEKAPELLAGIPETTDVLLVEPKLDKRTAYYKFLQKNADFVVCDDLDESGLSRWLVQYAKDQGASLSAADARYLVQRAGTNQQLLAGEIDKLALYDLSITRQAIDALVEPVPQTTIFELLEAAFGGNQKRAMDIYAQQRAARVEPQQIMAMVAWQLHVLAIVKTAGRRDPADIARQARLNPFVVRKAAATVRSMPLARLKSLIGQAVQLDTDMKSTAINADDALQHFVLTIADR